jgi:ABC-type glycerol-3-phosphate transport system substrate-binding protein
MYQRKLIALLLVLAMAASAVLTGCASQAAQPTPTLIAANTATQAPASPPATQAPPTKLKIFRVETQLTKENSTLLRELDQDVNVDIEFVTAPWDQYVQKINTLMATGEQLDLVICDRQNPYVAWAQQGLVISLDDIIDPAKDTYVDKLTNSETFKTLKVDGKRYYVPGIHQGCDWALYVRKDLLDKMSIPVDSLKTIDDLYNAMVKAKSQFDTYGFVFNDGMSFTMPIIGAFGGGGYIPEGHSFVVNNGVVEDLSISDKTKDGLYFLNKLYREGLLNKDFATKSTIDFASTGKALAFFTPASGASGVDKNLKQLDASYGIQAISPLNRGNGFQPRQGGFLQWLLAFIPKTSVNPRKALDLLEFVNDKEGRDLLVAGPKNWLSPEGVSPDGVFQLTVDPATRKQEWGSESGTSPLWWAFPSTVFGYIPVKDYPTFEEAYDHRVIYVEKGQENDPFGSRNAIEIGRQYATSDLLSETMLPVDNDYMNKLATIKFEAWTKIIMEQNPANLDGIWNEYVAKWKASGGDTFIKAYQDLYDANK